MKTLLFAFILFLNFGCNSHKNNAGSIKSDSSGIVYAKSKTKPIGVNLRADSEKTDNDTSRLILTNPETGRGYEAKSQKAEFFKSAFINLIKSNYHYQEDIKNLVGVKVYAIERDTMAVSRNNGSKIKNYYILHFCERVDYKENFVSFFIYDIDSNSLFYSKDMFGPYHLQYQYNNDYLARCARYSAL
jgi:hypothetical protein